MHSPTTVPEANDDTRTAGRGLISIAAAKVYFIIASYSVQLALPRLWDAHEFGRYAAAIAGASILNNVLIAATIQSVSKFVSEDDAMAPARLRQGYQKLSIFRLKLIEFVKKNKGVRSSSGRDGKNY